MKDYMLSIVIPTKNREKYASATVDQILSIKDERLQVVIQDNSETNSLSDLLIKHINDTRLKYCHNKGTLSFVDNFNLAVSQADGEYLCVIGDDDGIIPQIIDVVLWAKKNSIDAIKPSLSAVYFWPNSQAIKKSKDNGQLNVNKISVSGEICNPQSEVYKLLNNGAQHYLSLDMVKLYHGIVRRDCLESIKEVTGKYFGGLSPDIYISVALSLTVKKMIRVDFPLTISGICNKSGSSDSATGRHTGKLEDAPHFRGHKNYQWSKYVPNFYSVDTIWADSTLAAITDLNRFELIKKFNVEFLAINCFIKYPQFRNVIKASYKNYSPKNYFLSAFRSAAYFNYNIRALIRKILRKIGQRHQENYQINDVKDILEADKLLQNRFLEICLDTKLIIKSLDDILNN